MATIRPPISSGVLEEAAEVIRCLGHPLRLRLVERLERGECTVSELVEATGETQSRVSHQLAVLRGRGVVGARREGAYVHYELTEPRVRHILDCVRHCDELSPGADRPAIRTAEAVR